MLAGMRPGVVVANRFRIEAIAGAGGMGTVYRAADLAAGGHVALKTLAGIGERDAARFAREAAVLGELVHPGIVRFIAHGLTAEHEHYIAMEWLDGETLHDRLQRGPMALAETITLCRAIAEALGAAHARSVVHRDIKPMNLFLPGGPDASVRVKLLDFGIARHIRQAGMLTNTGVVIGTPGYMAPEQVRGETLIDARTDVFSLGCVLYRCLTGTSAFPGEQSLAVLAKILVDDVAPPSTIVPSIPAAIDALVLRMLHKSPAARPASGQAVAAALAALVDVTLRDVPGVVDRAGDAGNAATAEITVPSQNARSHDRTVITAFEERLVSLVLMVAGPGVTEADPDRVSMTAGAFGGRLERIGDGSNVVLFAHTDVATDHAVRAARCALALREVVGHAALVVASGRAAIDRQLVGDLIDRAAAAVAEAAPGQIVIDASTATLLDDRFVVSRGGERQFLRGIRDGAEPVRTLLGKTTPIVGRDRELANLEALWAECADERIARVVLVTAAPGAGKSRLRQELARRVLQRDEHAELLIGRGDSLRAGSPFSLIADAVRRTSGVREGDDVDAQRDALLVRVSRHVAASEADRVTHLLGEVAGVAFPTAAGEALRAARADPLAKGDAMRTAWVDFLEAECAHHPVLLVLEDLHWGDRPTIDLIDAALRELAHAPLMVIALARPEVHDAFPKLWAERALQEIRLPQLTRKASDRLVQALLGDAVAPELRTRIVERADGNAFFLEELIRAVAEGRGESLPDSVLSMLQIRLDTLGAEVKRVLRAGSVFGEVFWRGGIADLLGDESRDQLAGLVQRELIAVAPRTRIAGEVEYAFRHDLVREAAYATMSASDRIVAHQRAAGWLVANGFTDALVLAEHFSRGAQLARAAECYATAADQALAGNDHVAVFALVERGLACQPSEVIEARLHVVLAEACNWQGDHARAVGEAERARAVLPRGTLAWFRATDEAFYGAGRSGDVARAIAMVGDLTATVAAPDAVLQQLRSLARAALVMLRFGPPGVGAALVVRVEDLAARADVDIDTEQRLHTLRAMAARARGEAGRCFDEHAAGIRACEITHNLRELAFTHLSASNCYAEIGEPALSREHVERGIQISERVGATTVTPLLYFARGMAALEARDFADAQRSAARAIELASGRDRAAEGLARWVLARSALGSGDLATCERELAAALECLGKFGLYNSLVHAIAARLALARGNPAVARAAAARAMTNLRVEQGFEEGESLVRLVEIEALEALGEHTAARAAATIAIARIAERAARIDEPWRSKFLAKPDNAATLARLSRAGG